MKDAADDLMGRLGAWDSLVNDLIHSSMYVVAEDATAHDIKSAVVGTSRPRHYPAPFEGGPVPDACYSPVSPTREVVSVALSRVSSKKAAAPLLAEIAARRGLRVTSRVYATARHWFVETCKESTYTPGFLENPRKAV